MDRLERSAVVDRFNSGAATILLATDAAGEGLNLQHRCRTVVNLELPWNPMRLEQRVGRVDRIGQPRTVHAFNLLASGTAESSLLARLARRLECAGDAVGAVDNVLGPGEEAVVAAHLGFDERESNRRATRAHGSRSPALHHVLRFPPSDDARELAARLNCLRGLLRAAGARRGDETGTIARRRRGGVQAACVRRSRLPAAGGRTGVLALFRVRSQDPRGLGPFDELVPLFAECPWPRPLRRRDLRDLASAFVAGAAVRLAAEIRPRVTHAAAYAVAFDRDAAIAVRARSRRAVQRGLFDRRAEREAEDAESRSDAPRLPDETPDHPAARGAGADAACVPRLELLLFVTS